MKTNRILLTDKNLIKKYGDLLKTPDFSNIQKNFFFLNGFLRCFKRSILVYYYNRIYTNLKNYIAGYHLENTGRYIPLVKIKFN